MGTSCSCFFRKIGALALLSCPIFAVALGGEPLVRFGLIADVQYADAEPRINRFYRNSLDKLADCVRVLNAEQVDFTINLGDFVDKTVKELPPVLMRLGKLEKPLYNTTGNHDYGEVTDNASLYKRLGMPSAYYSFEKKGWKFIVLNTNEIAPYANIKGTPKEQEHKQMLARIKDEKRTNGAGYNGGIGKEQMEWLEKELKQASEAGHGVLVFSHHPLYPAKEYTALNDQEILQLLSRYSCVRAVISGHHHPGAFGLYEGIPCATLEGMVETEKENSFALVELYDDRIIFTGKGRAKSYEWALKKAPTKGGKS